MRWWLLQRFQQGVEGRLRELMHLVNDIEAETARRCCHADALTQVANFVDPPIGRAIDFQHIQGTTFADGDARLAVVTRLCAHPLGAI